MSTEIKRIEPFTAAKVALLMAIPAALLLTLGALVIDLVGLDFLKNVLHVSAVKADAIGIAALVTVFVAPLISTYIGTLVLALIYNLVAKYFGGLKLDLSNN